MNIFFNKRTASTSLCSESENYCKKIRNISYQSGSEAHDFICNRYGLLVIGHHMQITSLIISPSNKLLISGSMDGKIIVWDLQTTRQVSRLSGAANRILCLAITSDSKYIVSGSDNYNSLLQSLVVSRDSRYLVSGPGVRLWNIREAREEYVIGAEVLFVSVFSRDNKYLVYSGQDSLINIWNIQEKYKEFVMEGHSLSVLCIDISKDNRHVASGSADTTVRLWDFQQAVQEAVLQGHTSSVVRVMFTDNCKYVISSSTDYTARVWSVEYKHIVYVVEEEGNHLGIIITASSDSMNLVYGINRRIGIMDLSVGSVKKLEGHIDYISCIALVQDSSFVVTGSGFSRNSEDCTVRVWDIIEKKQTSVFVGHTQRICCIVISDDNKLIVTGSHDKTVRIWSKLSKEYDQIVLTGHKMAVYCIAISSDNTLVVTGSCDNTVRVWSIEHANQLYKFRCLDHPLCVSISSDNKFVVFGAYGINKIKGNSLEISNTLIPPGRSYSTTWVVNIDENTFLFSYSENMNIHMINLKENINIAMDTDAIKTLVMTRTKKYAVTSSYLGGAKVWRLIK